VTVSELRFWDEGLLHPVIKAKTKKLHGNPKQACAMGEIRMNRLVSGKISNIAAWGKRPFQGREGSTACSGYVGSPTIFFCLLVLLSAPVPVCGNHTD
jgi:hypothetical protein